MNKTAILVIGANEDQLTRLTNEINLQPLWNGEMATGDEMAIEKLLQSSYDLIVITDGITTAATAKLQKIVALQQPGLIILQHNADATVSLTDAIDAMLDEQLNAGKPTFSFVDDALKNAGLNIVIQ
ncbi:hypothetical protein BH11BAC3_BH11BAC3_47180 [soil metagenome]